MLRLITTSAATPTPNIARSFRGNTIIHLLAHFRNDGNGIVNAVIDLACSQARAGFDVVCIGSAEGAYVDLLKRENATPLVLSETGNGLFANIKHVLRVYIALRKHRPFIVHAHTIPTALTAKLLQLFLHFTLITTAHNGHRRRNALMAVGDTVICVSSAVARGMQQLGISEKKLVVVRNGPLGSPRRPVFTPHAQTPALAHTSIVTMSGLHSFKGIQDVIDAVALARRTIPELTLYVLGKGPADADLKRHVHEMGCTDCVHFVGFVEDPRPYLNQADVFVLASHREAFGLAIAEAREAGCAIIGTQTGGIPEVLEGGRSGILVPTHDPQSLQREIVKLLSDRTTLRHWQKQALANLNWLNVERVCRETLTVYSAATPWDFRPKGHQRNVRGAL